MTEENEQGKGGDSLSSTRLRRKKKSNPRNFEMQQETLSTTSSSLAPSSASSSSSVVLHGVDDRSFLVSRELRNSQSSTITERAANLSSKQPAHDSATHLLNASSLQHILSMEDSEDEDEGPDYLDAINKDNPGANQSSNSMDLSEVRIVNTRKPLEKEMTKSNHSKSGRRGGSRSRSRTLSRGSNSLRSMGSTNISRSSHCSLSAHTMASSLDSGTDSDLESQDCETDESYHELLSDNENASYLNLDKSAEKYREYLSGDDDDISDYDALWREKTQYDKRRASKNLDELPPLSYLQEHSSATEEVHNNSADQSGSTELTTTATSSSALVGEASAKLLLPTPDSPVKELRFSSLPPQEIQTNGAKQGISSLTTSRGNNDGNVRAVGILRKSVEISNAGPSEIEKQIDQPRRKSESNIDSKDEQFRDLENPLPLKRQVLWANELSKQYSHDSEDGVGEESFHDYTQDYTMPLDKARRTPSGTNGADVFFEMLEQGAQDAARNSKLFRGGGSLSSSSLNTLNSSNRQDSLSDVFETESSVNSQVLTNSTSHGSYACQSAANLVDSDRDPRIINLTSSSLSNLQDSQTDISGVSLSDDKKITLDPSISARPSSRKELDQKMIYHRDSIATGGQRPSNSETDPEISEDFYDYFFAPHEERRSAGSRGHLSPPGIHKKSSKKQGGLEDTKGLYSSDDSDCLMEYSESHRPGENGPIISHKSKKSSPTSSSVRTGRHVVRWVLGFLVFISGGLVLYFFIRSETNTDEDDPTQIDPLFSVDP